MKIAEALLALVHLLTACLAVCGQVREPVGIYVLQEVDKQNVSDTNLKKAVGLSIRVKWKSIDTGTTMKWGFLDGQVARAKKFGKRYMIRVMCGEHSPTWIGGQWFSADGSRAPAPWNTSAQAAHAQFVSLLGARYGNDPALTCVHLTSTCNFDNAEMHLAPNLNQVPGYSLQKLIDAWRFGIEDYSLAFPNVCCALNATIEPKSPWQIKGDLTDATVANCKSILGERATFQHNSLKASDAGLHHQLIHDLGNAGFRVGFQMVCPSSNRTRFGGPLSTAYAIGERAQATYYEIYQGDL